MFEARENTPTPGPEPAAGADSARSNNTNNTSATAPHAMSDATSAPATAAAPTCDGALSAPTAAELRALIERLAALDEVSLSVSPPTDTADPADPGAAADSGAPDLTGAVLVEAITVLERVKNACAAAQARLAVDLDRVQTGRDQARGLDEQVSRRSVAAQVGLARRCSPSQGRRLLGVAEALVDRLPGTLAAMTRGELSEDAAAQIARATAHTSRHTAGVVDARLHAEGCTRWAARRVGRRARALVDEHEPGAAAHRHAAAVTRRRVSVRDLGDGMAALTAIVPFTEAVAAKFAVRDAAAAVYATQPGQVPEAMGGTRRTRAQIEADLFIERLTGRNPVTSGCDVTIGVLMTPDTLVGASNTPARVENMGTLPGILARKLAATGTTRPTARPPGVDMPASGSPPDDREYRASRALIRRLFTDPDDPDLVRVESTSRTFTGLLRQAISLRDEVCRTPYCDAPIRHIDHIRRHTDGGPTSMDNGQGLCASCNYLKEHPDWHTRRDTQDDSDSGSRRHTVSTTTPTGHAYTSTPPPLPLPTINPRQHSDLEHRIFQMITAA
ncbi:DUF222 domain-containing protein [Calidifontibacter sp. DB0510]|uniref:DUF222 domain-containing protein n=1 Tax=Metallococcus carri TaxID=1656884 RepID=A0A967EGP1_9MICO|nr:HNH endonuclease signature motif containing protein [Metallococcus carri]NHN55338.1 DUF222 domain-containing protein [Metallococcus carri]NOP36415.1 DUF222 domain-containing protein [Calidifontibacter sp. DB2511S]